MKIKFKGARPREIAPANGRSIVAEPGAIIEVDDRLGASLLDQPRWFEKVDDKPKADRKADNPKEGEN